MDIVGRVIEKRLSGERLNLEDGIVLYQGDLLTLGKAATHSAVSCIRPILLLLWLII